MTIRKPLCHSRHWRRWCRGCPVEVLNPFFIAKQWQWWHTWTPGHATVVCYPSWRLINQMWCSSKMMCPHTHFLLSKHFLSCIFLATGLGMMDQFRGLRFHPVLCCSISSCGDMLKTLFTRPLWNPLKWSLECCCVVNSYTANGGEYLEAKWILLGHLTHHERHACWSCLAFCRIHPVGTATLRVTLSYSVSSLILFPVCKSHVIEAPAIIWNRHPFVSHLNIYSGVTSMNSTIPPPVSHLCLWMDINPDDPSPDTVAMGRRLNHQNIQNDELSGLLFALCIFSAFSFWFYVLILNLHYILLAYVCTLLVCTFILQ